ncbi:MAG TPA: Gfo/Idh/MocA family oxidoreductase, partial [Longimicrobiales bacterium]|nr:Gfo/Idh/MocA family oxidoreductase [Longimicrobiales bacterium]
MPQSDVSRRDFVAGSARAALGAMVVPRHVLGGPGHRAPSDTLDIAVVGCGGQGSNDALELVGENLVAFCDVDFDHVEDKIRERAEERERDRREKGRMLQDRFRRAARYTDYRVLLDERTDVDGVVIATPDHLHAPIAKAAMEAGKHVYVQKPLTWCVREARVLAETASRTGVVTQMGNQGHSSDEARLINEWIQAGLIGPVREVHVWTNRPIW